MKKIIIIILFIFIVIQFIPVHRNNPPVLKEINAPKEIQYILQRSCYDCHSNQTKWPWYSYLAPISYLISLDVHKGRDHLNFTEWNKYSSKKQKSLISEALEEIEKKEMPLPLYLLIHQDKKISKEEKEKLKKWAITTFGPLETEGNDTEHDHLHIH